jgi:hypothetical protein
MTPDDSNVTYSVGSEFISRSASGYQDSFVISSKFLQKIWIRWLKVGHDHFFRQMKCYLLLLWWRVTQTYCYTVYMTWNVIAALHLLSAHDAVKIWLQLSDNSDACRPMWQVHSEKRLRNSNYFDSFDFNFISLLMGGGNTKWTYVQFSPFCRLRFFFGGVKIM